MDIQKINNLGQLKKSGYQPLSIKDEIRKNLIQRIQNNEPRFKGILGYDTTVIKDIETAILSRHNILLLGLRGQAKTRIARQMVDLLDEYVPVIEGSEINDDPFAPVSKFGRQLIEKMGDQTPVSWLHRSERFGEKLATPDVSVADLIGDIDPIKAANLRLSFSDEEVIHYGIIPRCNRSIFVINELPDLQARIQVALFNILQEGDIQIRGFKLRLNLDMLFVFTANPEDYTSRGSIVTPLKDRIESQILTHYPKDLKTALKITEQEADLLEEQTSKVTISDLVKKIVEQIAFEARKSEYVDRKSGVSARLTIAALENLVSSAERRAMINKEKATTAWISDLMGIIPAITGKIELVYEGEQEGPYQVALHLLEKAIRSQFILYFPVPAKRSPAGKPSMEGRELNPYRKIISWFDQGGNLDMMVDMKDQERIKHLKQVTGLSEIVKEHYPDLSSLEHALMMEFILHGLSAYSLISKKVVEGQIHFNDLIGSMMDFDDEEA